MKQRKLKLAILHDSLRSLGFMEVKEKLKWFRKDRADQIDDPKGKGIEEAKLEASKTIHWKMTGLDRPGAVGMERHGKGQVLLRTR